METTKQALKWICIAGVFVVLAIPLYISNSLYFPFIAGKSFTFRIIVEIITAAWIGLLLLDRTYAPKRSWIMWGYSAFIVIIAIADIFGVYPYKSFWSNYERMEGLVEHLHLFAYFLVAASVLQTEKMWNWFWNTALGVSIIMTIYGFSQLAGKITIDQGGTRVDGTLGNAAYMAIYMFFGMAIAAFLLARSKEAWQKWIYGVLVVVQGIVLYYTQTRGTILGLVAALGIITLLVALFGKESPRLRKTAIGGLIAVIVLVGGFFLVRNASFVKNSPVLSRFATISLTERTTVSRFLIWNMAWQGFKERPILGWGQENFNYVFNKFYNPQMYDQEQWFDRTHDVFFDWLIAGGILGLGAYLYLFGAVIASAWKRTRFSLLEKSILTGLLAGYFIHNIFVFDNFTSYLLFFAFAAFLHSTGVYGREGEHSHAKSASLINWEVALYGAVPVLAVLAAIGIYFLNVRPIDAGQTLVGALQTESAVPATSLADYQQAIGLGTFGSPEIRERLMLDAPNISASQNATADVKQQFLTYAKDQMDVQINRAPLDARYLLFMGSFLDQFGRNDEALTYLARAEAASPEKQSILIEEGVSLIGKKDYPNALAKFKQAYDLAPDYIDARVIYAIGATYAGQKDLAASLLKPIDPVVNAQNDRLLSAYVALGDYQNVLLMWNERLRQKPNDVQTELSYSATLLKLGKNQDAIAELQKIEAANPNYAAQIEQYITAIKEGKNPVQGN